MAAFRSFFVNFRAALLLLFVYLGCIFFSPAAGSPNPQPKRRKISPLSNHQSPASSSAHLKPHRSLSLSLRSYLRHLFSFSGPGRPTQPQQEQQTAALTPVVDSAQPHLHVRPAEGEKSENRNPLKVISSSGSPAARVVPAVGIAVANVASGKRSSFPSRDDVFPCAACGEVFSKTHLLDLHQATRHAFSELADGDSGKNIVQIIFQSGWKGNGARGDEAPVVRRVFKIHNSAKTVARFEEHRESVRSRAAARWAAGRGGGGEERCVADGNERLRFYCATFMCGLDREGNPGACGSPFCAACGIVRHGEARTPTASPPTAPAGAPTRRCRRSWSASSSSCASGGRCWCAGSWRGALRLENARPSLPPRWTGTVAGTIRRWWPARETELSYFRRNSLSLPSTKALTKELEPPTTMGSRPRSRMDSTALGLCCSSEVPLVEKILHSLDGVLHQVRTFGSLCAQRRR